MGTTIDRPVRGWLVIGLLAGTLLAAGRAEAQVPSGIRGRVLDASGGPLAAALVSVQSKDSMFRDRIVFTDQSGAFSIPDLVAGDYVVTVTRSNFIPAVASGVELLSGTDAVLTVNLQTALDIVQRRGLRRGTEDMKWILRSSASTRPGLRHAPADLGAEEPSNGLDASNPSGYLQVYSTSLETGAGPTDSVGSQFEVTLPVAKDSEVTLSGQIAEASDQPQGFGASYEFSQRGRQRSSVAVNIRQGAFFNDALLGGSERREINLEYGEQFQWSDRIVLGYGATVGRADGVDAHNYLRPEMGVTWVPSGRTAVHATFSTRAPMDTTDPIRGHEYFDRAVYIPSEMESFSHAEVGVTYVLSDVVQLSTAAFRDRLGTQAFLIDSENGRRGIMIFDTTDAPSTGVRLTLDRMFKDFETGIGYTYVSAVGFDPDVASPEDLRSEASRRNLHVITARVKADIELTQTEVTAVYRWASGFSMAPVDPYQSFAEYNDPTLSITLAQDLPQVKALPASFQAVVDARNLFDPSFGTRRTVYAGYPKLLRGGIHIKF